MSNFPFMAERTPLLGPLSATSVLSSKILSETKVYPLIHLIRVDILSHIDTPLTYEQLLAPDSTYTIVRPLTEKYLELQNQSIIFCLLLNKVQFVRDSAQLSISTLSTCRATLCEILAIRVLRGWSERTLPLATVLLTPWGLYQGASQEILDKAKEEGDEDTVDQGAAALEMAIISYSKRFIRSPSCQKVIEGIWSGRIIYSGVNAHALIADNYKKKPIQMYNPHKAPLLDHYRLKVPKVRSFLEYTNFLILFILYVLAVEGLEEDRLNGKEVLFIIYALAYSLDKLATIREHGLKVFSSSLVNGFDFVFMLIYFIYLGARSYGFHYNDANALALGQDWLAIGAVLIFPRLAFVTLANNLMVLSIRSMLTEFFFLMGIGIFCFLGFLYALFTLGQGRFALSQIGWWLLEVYFGLDASGFETSHDLHPFLGPILMVTYALLSNTLLLTVLVAILGNTFATISADAAAESMYRNAVSTLEGVKADAVFSYQLPFNLVAVVFMWPMSYILNPRWFHKVNVFMIRASNFPVLLVIALYERSQYRETSIMDTISDFLEHYLGSFPRKLKQAAGFDTFSSRHDVSLLFEIEREVGTAYRDTEDEDEDFQLPEAQDSDMDSHGDAEQSLSGNGHGYTTATSFGAPFTASPAKTQFDDGPKRRQSVVGHKRRMSSIHEPSPLARLFVGEEAIARARRQSFGTHHPTGSLGSGGGATAMGSGAGVTGSQTTPMISSYSMSPGQSTHTRTGPQVPSIPPAIQEGKPLELSPNTKTTKRRVPFPSSAGSASSARSPGTPGGGSQNSPIAKASDMDDMHEEEELGSLDRLKEIERRQKRIEEMLEILTGKGEDKGKNTRKSKKAHSPAPKLDKA